MPFDKKIAPSLALLTASALALPGVSQKAQAAEPTSSTRVQIGYSHYREDGISSKKTFSSDRERYEIDIGQFQILSPLGESGEFGVNVSHEKMSGASPWFVLSGFSGEPIQVMSGATISEKRNDTALSYKHYYDKSAVQINVGASDEDDYESRNIGIVIDKDFAQSSISGGISYSRDKIEPVDNDIFLSRVNKADKYSHRLSLSVTQVINPTTVLQAGVSYERQWGYLSDPYKLTIVGGIPLQDSRPQNRSGILGKLGLRHFVRFLDATFQFDYRYYHDNWGILSHTFDIAWHQSLPAGWAIKPSVRHYSQTQAGFFGNTFSTSQQLDYFSSDYRLSAYGAWTYGLAVEKMFSNFGVELSASRYKASEGASILKAGDGSPGLVDFTLYSVLFSFEF